MQATPTPKDELSRRAHAIWVLADKADRGALAATALGKMDRAERLEARAARLYKEWDALVKQMEAVQ